VSDGVRAPSDLVRYAHEQGVLAMALTDHDTTDGMAEALQTGAELGVRIIPGIEISTDLPGASIHVLGLFLDWEQPAFQEMIRRFQDARVTRLHNMINKLAELGAPLDANRVLEIAGEGSVGRPHVARAVREAGHVASIQEAFDRFLAHGQPAYFEGYRLEPKDAVDLIHSVGGVAAWAHPYEINGKDWHELMPPMLESGIDALEVYYGHEYGPEAIPALLDICRANDLIPTVGSDYHGFVNMDRPPGSVPAPKDTLARVEARAHQRRKALSA
jgi:predicted metal-dependent phosphoesterase TrpH